MRRIEFFHGSRMEAQKLSDEKRVEMREQLAPEGDVLARLEKLKAFVAEESKKDKKKHWGRFGKRMEAIQRQRSLRNAEDLIRQAEKAADDAAKQKWVASAMIEALRLGYAETKKIKDEIGNKAVAVVFKEEKGKKKKKEKRVVQENVEELLQGNPHLEESEDVLHSTEEMNADTEIKDKTEPISESGVTTEPTALTEKIGLEEEVAEPAESEETKKTVEVDSTELSANLDKLRENARALAFEVNNKSATQNNIAESTRPVAVEEKTSSQPAPVDVAKDVDFATFTPKDAEQSEGAKPPTQEATQSVNEDEKERARQKYEVFLSEIPHGLIEDTETAFKDNFCLRIIGGNFNNNEILSASWLRVGSGFVVKCNKIDDCNTWFQR